MDVIPYRQSLTHSCLVACFLMVMKAQYGVEFTAEDERRLALKGSDRNHPFYVAGVPVEVAREFKKDTRVYVDNKFFANVLSKAFVGMTQMHVVHKPITIGLIKELLTDRPVICHIDTHGLGDYSHSSHFIVVERAAGSMIHIVDPWTGRARKVTEKTLEKAILSLKTEVKICPLLFLLIARRRYSLRSRPSSENTGRKKPVSTRFFDDQLPDCNVSTECPEIVLQEVLQKYRR